MTAGILVFLVQAVASQAQPAGSFVGGQASSFLGDGILMLSLFLGLSFVRNLNPFSVKMELRAVKNLTEGHKAPPVSHAYLAWRRSQLNIGVLLYVIVLFMLVTAVNIVSLSKRGSLGEQADKAQLLQTFIAIVFYYASAWRWVSYDQSIRLVACGWFLVFFLPFIYFFVPMDIVSPKENVQYLCRCSLNLLSEVYSTGEARLQLDGKPVDIEAVCSKDIEDMASTAKKLKLLGTGTVSSPQLLLTLVGLLLRYIVYLPFLMRALEALKSLAPGVLGLMLGLQGGLKMSKLMFPGVRVTSWMLIILQASALPIVMCIMALLLVVVGTIPVMATAVLITASMSLYLIFSDQLLRAVTPEAAQAIMAKLGRIAFVLQILGLGFLLLGVYVADHLVLLKAVKNMISALFVVKLIVGTLAGMFVSKVVFVDVVLHIIISTYIGVYDDPSETRRHVFEKLTLYADLFPRYQSYKGMRAPVPLQS